MQCSNPPNSAAPIPRSAVFFDGSCPLCSREIALYRKLPTRGAIDWIDIAAPGFCPPNGTTGLALMQRLHVLTPDGEMVSGARAFVQMWSQLPRWRYLARIAKFPGLLPLMEIAYRVFLVFRPCVQAVVRWRTQR